MSVPSSAQKPAPRRFQILVCDGPSCGVTYESECLVERLRKALDENPTLAERVGLADFTCFGRCDDGPNMFVQELGEGEEADGYPDQDLFEIQRGFYPTMDEEKVIRILEEHCGAGQVVEELVDDY